jgi:hypothetical protein
MFIVLTTLILFYSLLFWYAIHENSVVEARNSWRKQNND